MKKLFFLLIIQYIFISCQGARDCIDTPKWVFPFLYEIIGPFQCASPTLSNSVDPFYGEIRFYDNGRFELSYYGECNIGEKYEFCVDSLGNNKLIELEIEGSYEYSQSIRTYGGSSGFFTLGGDSRPGHKRLKGKCRMYIESSSEASLVGDSIISNYRVDCNGSIIFMAISDQTRCININCQR